MMEVRAEGGAEVAEAVLFVDDEPDLLQAYRRFLTHECAVETAASAEQALVLMADRPPFAVVVADLELPGMDGIQFLSRVRERWVDSVRVLLSGRLDLARALHAINTGNVFRALTKPCAPDDLIGAVRAAREQYELLQADRRRADHARRASEALSRAVLDSVHARIAVLDRTGTVLTVNGAWGAPEAHAGSAPAAPRLGDLVGKHYLTLWGGGDEPAGTVRVIADGVRAVLDGTRAKFEFEYSDGLTGRVRWTHLAVTPLSTADGGVVVSLADITERKQAEESLRQSEERYRQLFERNPHPMWVHDDDTRRFLAANDSAVRHYGYPRERFLTMSLDEIAVPLGPAAPPRGGHARHRLASGEVREVEVGVHPIEFDGRRACLALVADVTERKLLEDQLKQAQKLEAIGQLAAGVAHEINTPIQYIGDNTNFLSGALRDVGEVLGLYRAAAADPARLAAAERAAGAVDLDYLLEEAPRAIAQSLEGLGHVARIVKAMKEFAHPGTEDKAPVDLNHALETVIAVARNEWKYAAEVVTDLAPDLPSVVGLAGELNQVFLNLLVNAAHAVQAARRPDGPKGTITVSTRRAGGVVEVRVADTGCGIPEAHRARVFEPFYTTKPVGQGTGQGLALAHAVVVQRHGGAITFDTEVGAGTTFVVRLPIEDRRLTRSEVVGAVSPGRRATAGAGGTP